MTALTPATQHTKQLFIIDKNVDGWRDLVNNAGVGVSVLLLDPLQNGLTQIANAITAYSNLDAIHILSHGSVASLQLGSATLNSENLNQYTQQLTTIGNALSENGDLLLYGCNVAQGETGKQFIQALAQVTGVDVAASDDLTGNAVLGGDSILEVSTGSIETNTANLSDYSGVLQTRVYSWDYLLAKMSNFAYQDNSPSIIDVVWNHVNDTHGSISSEFFGVAYKNQNADEIIIAYRGTDIFLFTDVSADKAIIGSPLYPNWDAEFTDALNFAWDIKKANPTAKISVTGHSLGGALAQVVSQMFGFDGATFDPGGAGNLLSTDFNKWASDLKQSYPELTLNQGVGTGFLNYLVTDSLVSGLIPDHVGETFPLENQTWKTFFLDWTASLLSPVEGIALKAVEQYLLHTMDGIEALMKARADNTETSFLTQNRTTTISGVATGDISPPILSSAQSQTEFYSSQYNPYVFANDLDNIIYGYAGNDAIYSLAGNDTVYGGDGNDTISTAQGNDVIDAGSGVNTIMAGSGNDTITAGLGNDSIDGGLGTDKLILNFSVDDYPTIGTSVNYRMWDKDGNILYSFYNTSSSWDATYSARSSFDTIYTALSNATTFTIWDGYWSSLLYEHDQTQANFRNIENVSLTTGKYNDLLIAQGNGDYHGGDGADTFYADWSNSTTNIIWNNDSTQTQSINGITASGIERLLLTTGSGNDTLDNSSLNNSSNGNWNYSVFITGAGNDTIVSRGWGDIIDAGSGNDIISAQAGNTVIDGGSGFDTLTLDITEESGSFGVELSQGGYQYFSGHPYASWSFEQLHSALVGVTSFSYHSDSRIIGMQYRNVEAVNVIDTGANIVTQGVTNNLIIYQNGTYYDGGSGFDTFYADWSNATTDIIWNNAPTQIQTVNGITVSGLERLLLMTGSGDDTLSNLNTVTDDYFDSGAGNDSIQSGAGNDTLHGGGGVDVLQGGDGNDVYQFNIGDGHDQIIDTTGTDTLVFGANITATQIGVSRIGNEIRLAISINDSIRFTENAVGSYAIERIEFQDGTVWTTTQIQQKVNSMVNHAPVGADKTITLNEDSSYTLTTSDFGFNDIDVNTLLSVTISSLPSAGSLKLNGVAVVANASISVSDINNGLLTFSPVAHANGIGYASMTFKVQDNGGTANGGVDLAVSANTLSFTVLAVPVDTSGNNSYTVNSLTDVVIEKVGEGWDVVTSNIDNYALPDNVEVLLFGAGVNRGSGNAQANYLLGNSLDNTVDGGLGNDVMAGYAGNDTYFVDSTNINAEWAVDFAMGDVVVEGANEGIDTVNTSVSYVLRANIENLVLIGNAIGGGGNALNNSITGNAADNILNGGAGVDTVIGSAGNDVYFVDETNDVTTELGGEGSDIVFSTATNYVLNTNVEHLIVWGAGLNGTGNAGDNIIYGNVLNNTLTDGAGSDILVGGRGKDTYNLSVDSTTDTLYVSAGDSLVSGYDKANNFNLGGSTGADRLDLPTTFIAPNTSFLGGAIAGSSITGASISNGIISFHGIGNAAISTASLVLSDALAYIQANIIGGNTVAFVAGSDTFVFQDAGNNDTLIDLVGVTATSVNTTGVGAGAVWIV